MKLRTDEHVLTGSWLYIDHVMRGDSVCYRIEWLITNHLKNIASNPIWGDWETLFQDPSDGGYWERTYPQGDLQGGGPPQLKVISEDDGKEKYGI